MILTGQVSNMAPWAWSCRGAAVSQAGVLPLPSAGRQGGQDRRQGVDVAQDLELPETVLGITVGGSV